MSETKSTTDIEDTVIVSTGTTKVGETIYKQRFVTGSTIEWKYNGELVDDKPHGKGTITSKGASITIEWRNGEPLVGCDMICKTTSPIKMEFEGKFLGLGKLDSEGMIINGWIFEGTALFPVKHSSFTGQIRGLSYLFIKGIYKTELISVRFLQTTDYFCYTSRQFVPSVYNFIVTSRIDKKTYYRIGDKMFFNRNGITYFHKISDSTFFSELTSGKVCSVPESIGNTLFYHTHNYTPDDELERLAGFSDE